MDPTPERVRELLDYDIEAGTFRWRLPRGPLRAGAKAGKACPDGRIVIKLDRHFLQAGRLAWIHARGPILGGLVIDHIDGNPGNNRISNLRPATFSENKQNQHRPAGKNPVVGVSWHRQRANWRATIAVDGKYLHLGSFDDVEAAQRVYLDAKRRYHGIDRQLTDGAVSSVSIVAVQQGN